MTTFMARAVAFQAFEACFDLDLRGAVLPSMFHLSHFLHDKGVYYMYITMFSHLGHLGHLPLLLGP